MACLHAVLCRGHTPRGPLDLHTGPFWLATTHDSHPGARHPTLWVAQPPTHAAAGHPHEAVTPHTRLPRTLRLFVLRPATLRRTRLVLNALNRPIVSVAAPPLPTCVHWVAEAWNAALLLSREQAT
jgi:hypothetical protein